MKKVRLYRCILAAAMLLNAAGVLAQSGNLLTREGFQQKRGYFLARFGFISGKVVVLDGHRIDGTPGASFGAALDFRAAKHLLLGVSADIHRMHVSDSGQYFFDISLNAKPSFYSKRAKVGFRPGVGLGFGVMDYFVGVEQSTYMVWKTTFEMIFYGATQNAWFIDVGMMGTAFGGNSEHRLRFGPFPYARAGMMF